MPDLLNYRPSASAIYYTPTRRINVRRTIASFLVAALLVIGGSFLYARLLPWMTSLIPRAGAPFAAALAVGVLAVIPVHFGRIRISAVAAAIGALLSLIALYVMWVVWTQGVLNRLGAGRLPMSRLALHPEILFRLMIAIGNNGTWSYQGTVCRGVALFGLWMIEAGLILSAGVLLPVNCLYSDDPTCSDCQSRCVRARDLPRFDAGRQSIFLSNIEDRDFEQLATHEAPPHSDVPELSLKLMYCPKCGTTRVLTVSRVAWELGSQNRLTVKTKPLIDQLLITPEEATNLIDVCRAIQMQRRAMPADIDESIDARVVELPEGDERDASPA